MKELKKLFIVFNLYFTVYHYYYIISYKHLFLINFKVEYFIYC